MKKGDIIEVAISDYAFEGKGIAKIPTVESDKEFVVFVAGAYPGDRVKVLITKKKKNFAEGRIQEFITKSDFRIEAKCIYFGTCGGCKQQDLDYYKQLEFKQAQVVDAFERIGDLSGFTVEPIIGSEKVFFYRNKMEYSFSDKRWLTKDELNSGEEIENRNFALGLHIPRIFDKVLDIHECWLQSDKSNSILNATRQFFLQKGETIYSTKTHVGYLRHLVIKSGHHTGDLMVNLVTSEWRPELMEEYAKFLNDNITGIKSIINNINYKKGKTAIGDEEHLIWGEKYIYDYIGSKKYRISANSFFQTNTLQAERLYSIAKEYAEFNGNETVYDLYCGAGTISIFMSDDVREILGFESVEPAIEDAKVNSGVNNSGNTKFYIADLNKSFLPLLEKEKIPRPDVIITDPPRSGMNPKTVKDIIQLNPSKLVYISCNPTTQARDVKLLTQEGNFELVKIRPVDMFPHTYHIENVALLVNNSHAVSK